MRRCTTRDGFGLRTGELGPSATESKVPFLSLEKQIILEKPEVKSAGSAEKHIYCGVNMKNSRSIFTLKCSPQNFGVEEAQLRSNLSVR